MKMVKLVLLCNEIASDFLLFYLYFESFIKVEKKFTLTLYKYVHVNIFKLTIMHIYILS